MVEMCTVVHAALYLWSALLCDVTTIKTRETESLFLYMLDFFSLEQLENAGHSITLWSSGQT